MKNFDKYFNRQLNISKIKIEMAFLKLQGVNDGEAQINVAPNQPEQAQQAQGEGIIQPLDTQTPATPQ